MYESWCGVILRNITSLLNKKIEIQNESKQSIATSVSKAVTYYVCVFQGIFYS